ncbi:MAG: phytoene/squalene synthase family protein [Pseudomonadota bacterium]|nr:phytoene/squalene synthase family protein [Pseudomonadota bacterium]
MATIGLQISERVPLGDRPAVARSGDPLPGRELQGYLLNGVSRTFALTIPQLPARLAWVVANAYLLCRIVDTIEDEPALTVGQKRYFCERFVEVVAGASEAQAFANELAPRLSDATSIAEQELVRLTPEVVRVTEKLNGAQRGALLRCIRVMAQGMAGFQEAKDPHGLQNIAELERYCYYVAGVVGEMLTTLFCDHSPLVARNRDALMGLAVSFGQGLQMTNILKDIWDDQSRGACWLPQDVFSQAGFDLLELEPGRFRPGFGQGLARLIGVTYGHLSNALAYTLLLPRQETGIRNFCLWNIGMAVLTLRKIHRHPDFDRSQQVKISRRSVMATIVASRLTAAHDHLLRALFHMGGIGLPRGRPRQTPV